MPLGFFSPSTKKVAAATAGVLCLSVEIALFSKIHANWTNDEARADETRMQETKFLLYLFANLFAPTFILLISPYFCWNRAEDPLLPAMEAMQLEAQSQRIRAGG